MKAFRNGGQQFSPRFQFQGRSDDVPRGLHVATFAEVNQGRPRLSDHDAGTTSGNRRRGVDAAGPIGNDENLSQAIGLVAIHNQGGALGREAVLMRVARNAGDAREAEVGDRHRETGLLHERIEVTAEAAVHVDRDAVPHPELQK